MSDLNELVNHLVKRALRMAVMVPSVERHLLEDQEAAIGGGGSNGGRKSGVSDPTPAMVKAVAPFARHHDALMSALRDLDRKFDDIERVGTAAISTGAKPVITAEERCPGWNLELRARLGGCGKHLEHYTDTAGMQHVRSTRLCVSCRKAKERSERELERASEDAA